MERMHGGGIGPLGLEPFARDIEAKTKRAAAKALGKRFKAHVFEARENAKTARDCPELGTIAKAARLAMEHGRAASALYMAIRELMGKPYRRFRL